MKVNYYLILIKILSFTYKLLKILMNKYYYFLSIKLKYRNKHMLYDKIWKGKSILFMKI
jgi:hypothetical protein